MRKSIIIITVLSAALFSCKKSVEPEVKTGVPMTVTASIADLTKTIVSPDGNALKSSWDANESISIVTLDASSRGRIVAVDKFTSNGEAGRTYATFTGTFTGGTSPKKVIALYPALEFDGTSYSSKPYKSSDGETTKLLSGLKIGDSFSRQELIYPPYQNVNDDCRHLTDYCVMVGKTNTDDIKNGNLNVSLRNLMMVLKVNASFPDAYKNKKLTCVLIKAYNSEDNPEDKFLLSNFGYADLDADLFSGYDDGSTPRIIMPTDFNIPESGKATIYIPYAPHGKSTIGSKWVLEADVNEKTLRSESKTFTKEVTFEAAKMYRMDVTFSE